ncbi:MAG: DUF2062 domain-containing protein [Reichenbachiella sp.]
MIAKIKQYKNRLKFKLKRDFIKILQSEDSIRLIAISYGIGTFVALMPAPGFCTIVALILVAIFRRLSKLSVFIAILLYNAVTIIPFYWVGLLIGGFIFSEPHVPVTEIDYANILVENGKRFVVGTLVIVIPYSIASSFFALWFIKRLRINRKIVPTTNFSN